MIGARPRWAWANALAVGPTFPSPVQSEALPGSPGNSTRVGRDGVTFANQSGGRYTYACRAEKWDTLGAMVTPITTPSSGSMPVAATWPRICCNVDVPTTCCLLYTSDAADE